MPTLLLEIAEVTLIFFGPLAIAVSIISIFFKIVNLIIKNNEWKEDFKNTHSKTYIYGTVMNITKATITLKQFIPIYHSLPNKFVIIFDAETHLEILMPYAEKPLAIVFYNWREYKKAYKYFKKVKQDEETSEAIFSLQKEILKELKGRESAI